MIWPRLRPIVPTPPYSSTMWAPDFTNELKIHEILSCMHEKDIRPNISNNRRKGIQICLPEHLWVGKFESITSLTSKNTWGGKNNGGNSGISFSTGSTISEGPYLQGRKCRTICPPLRNVNIQIIPFCIRNSRDNTVIVFGGGISMGPASYITILRIKKMSK